MAINRIELANSDGTKNVLLDLSGDTLARADQVAKGIVAHLRDGTQVTGTLEAETVSPDGNSGITMESIDNGDGTQTLVILNPDDDMNLVTKSTDTDGNIFNSTGYQLRSTLTERGSVANAPNGSSYDNMVVTGFIPCLYGDHFVFDNFRIPSAYTVIGALTAYWGVYDENKKCLFAQASYNLKASVMNPEVEGDWVKSSHINQCGSADMSLVRYIRFSGFADGVPVITKG